MENNRVPHTFILSFLPVNEQKVNNLAEMRGVSQPQLFKTVVLAFSPELKTMWQ